MNINTRDMNFVKFNGEEMQWVKVNGVTVYEAWKQLMAQGPVPLVLMKSSGMDLVDYKIFGNSVQEGKIPGEYQQVEYIQNSGAQYIDTGIIPDNSTGIELVYQALDYATSQYLAGARVGWSGSIFYGVNGSGSRTEWDVRFNSVVTYSTIQRTDHKMKTKVILNNGDGTWNLEDLETGEKFDTTLTGKVVSSTTNLMLFAYSPDNIHKNLRIYSCKLYSGEELIKDFIPCYRKSDNKIGMYDLISGTFYSNPGTGVFLKGNDTPTPELPVEIRSVGEKTKNLFNINNIVSGNVQIKDDVLTTSTYGATISQTLQQVCPELKVGDTVVLNAESNASNNGTILNMIYILDPKISWKFGTSLTVTQECLDSKITFYCVREDGVNTEGYYKNIQIELGTIPTEYEPFGKYKIPVTVSNNLFKTAKLEQGSVADATGAIADSASRVRTNLFVLEKGTYTISMNWNLQKCMIKGVHVYNYEDEKWIKYIGGGTSNLNFSLDERSKIRIVFNKSASAGETVTPEDILNSDVIIRPGEATTDFMEENININIYLNEPLRKIGDYADFIDFENQKVVRAIEKRLCSELSWTQHQTYPNIYSVNSARFKRATGFNAMSEVFNSTLYQPSVSIKDMSVDFCIKSHATSSALYISDSVHTTIDEFKEFVKNFYIQYILDTPIEETIVLPNIPTFNGTTVFQIDAVIQPDHIEVIYIGK